MGKRSFNEQFPALGVDNATALAPHEESTDLFGGMSRDDYLQKRVHRRLQMQVSETFSDEQLADLGRLSFVDQFGMCNMDPFQAPTDGDAEFDVLGDCA